MLRVLVAWVEWVVRHRGLVLLLTAVSVGAAALYTAKHFRLNSNTRELVHQDAPFRRVYSEFNQLFPDYDNATLIVLSSASHRRASQAAKQVTAALRSRPDLFLSVYSADESDFFEDHALLYLDPEELDEVVTRLAEAQPALAALAKDPSLRGLSQQLSDALDALGRTRSLPTGFARTANRLAAITEERLAGVRAPMSWEEEFLRPVSGEVHHLVIVQGREDFSARISSERVIDGVREIASRLGLDHGRDVRLRLTGMVPLAYEELESVRSSVIVAAGVAFVCLTSIMIFGARSLRVIVASLATVIVGIVWTSAFAMASVGEFNTFSIAFSVLLIGLGVDFSIHLCLRTQEGLAQHLGITGATVEASRGVGLALTLCALTSSIGFFSFVPTDYDGLADLGTITGGGMFLTLIASLSVTPAVLTSLGTPRGRPVELAFSSRSVAFLSRHGRTVGALALLLALAAAWIGRGMTFDYSTLGTKDPASESMTTLRELQQAEVLTDYAVTLVASNRDDAQRLARRLESLPLVREVRLPEYYLPDEQGEKLELIDDAAFLLGPALLVESIDAPPSAGERVAAIETLHRKAAALAATQGDSPELAATRRLANTLERVLSSPEPKALLKDLEGLVVSDLADRLDWLTRALAVTRVGFADLPESLRRRLVSPDGHVLISALPREDVSEVRALTRFLDAVSAIDPNATGRPVVEAGIGEIVVGSFYQAIVLASLGILLVVLLALRDVIDTILVLVPLALTALFTIAAGVLLDIPFNMVNVLVIPLILGLGVDNGIHIVMRYRNEGSLEAVLCSSTPRAIVLSGLTTLGAFGALAIAPHPGISSMGVMLSISILNLLACTLIVLPALLAWRSGGIRPPTANASP